MARITSDRAPPQAVGLSCGQIKAGAPCRGERTAKYNQVGHTVSTSPLLVCAVGHSPKRSVLHSPRGPGLTVSARAAAAAAHRGAAER